MTKNPLDDFTVNTDEITWIGEGLKRPECILAEKDGTLWSADERGGVVRISPDGTQEFIPQRFAQGGIGRRSTTAPAGRAERQGGLRQYRGAG